MIKFSCTNENYTNDLMELVRAFEQRTDECLSLDVSFVVREGEICIKLVSDKFDNFCKYYRYPLEFADATEKKRLEKRYLKMAIYGTLVFLTGVTLPYGCLTGIRPTKLYMELGDAAHDTFLKDFSVSPSKVELIERTVNTQKNLCNGSERNCDVFVFIPFCPTKCAYCSFVSLPIDRQKNCFVLIRIVLSKNSALFAATWKNTVLTCVPFISAAELRPRFRLQCSTKSLPSVITTLTSSR